MYIYILYDIYRDLQSKEIISNKDSNPQDLTPVTSDDQGTVLCAPLSPSAWLDRVIRKPWRTMGNDGMAVLGKVRLFLGISVEYLWDIFMIWQGWIHVILFVFVHGIKKMGRQLTIRLKYGDLIQWIFMEISIGNFTTGGVHKLGDTPRAGCLFFLGNIPSIKMDDDNWGYPHDETETSMSGIHR